MHRYVGGRCIHRMVPPVRSPFVSSSRCMSIQSFTERPAVKNWLHVIRFHSPTGTMLLALPCFYGMLAGWTRLLRSSASFDGGVSVVNMCDPTLPALFLLGSFTMRSAGCIINDLWDRNIDSKVERTKNRPIASGAMTVPTAGKLLVGHLTLGLGVLACLHPSCFFLSLYAMPLVLLYPLAKRFTMFPQVVLGMCFNWGVFVGNAAVLGRVDLLSCIPLYLACISWTVLYDTVYAFQDIKDDRQIGVRSFAIYLDGKKKRLLHILILTKVLFALAGGLARQSWVYHMCMLGSTKYLFHEFRKIDENKTETCATFFRNNVKFGFLVVNAWCIGNIFLYYIWAPVQDEDEGFEKEDITNEAQIAVREWLITLHMHFRSATHGWHPTHFNDNLNRATSYVQNLCSRQ